MSEEPPVFSMAKRLVEHRLTSLSDSPVRVSVYHRLDPWLLGEIMRLEEVGFRGELRYTGEEIEERARKPGFTAITIENGGSLLAFFFGYEDPDLPGGFYGDSMVSASEGKGVGGSLFTLVHLYCFHAGYSHFSCHAETVDEKGRRLREWYEGTGMSLVSSGEEGDLMRVELTGKHVSWMHRRFILGEKLPRRSP